MNRLGRPEGQAIYLIEGRSSGLQLGETNLAKEDTVEDARKTR